jgi:hypothetical protein
LVEITRIRRWQRISQLAIESDELRALRGAIIAVCDAPEDPGVRERLRAMVDAGALHAQLVALLAVEGRGVGEPTILRALREEANVACAQLERPRARLAVLEANVQREPAHFDHREHLAWVYYLVGAWFQSAQELETLVPYAPAPDALGLLRAAGRLYRNSGHNDRATLCYRAIAMRKPGDIDALLALGELVAAPPVIGPNPFDPKPAPAPIPTQTSAHAPFDPKPPAQVSAHVPVDPKSPEPTVAAQASAHVPVGPKSAPRVELPPALPEPEPSPFATLDDAELDASIDFALGEPSLIRKLAVTAEPEAHTSIEFDAIPDAVNTGEHAVPNLDFDDDVPAHLR